MINQISKGVYVVSPDAQKRYQDTAAGEYTSVYTKARANMWEMSKQQAVMNIQEDSARYKTEMALYAARIADMDERAKALEAAKADYLAGRTTADATLQKSAIAERTDLIKNNREFAKAQAEQFGLSSGGESSSTGGTGGGASKKTASTGKVQEWETATAQLSRREKLAQLKQIGRPGGILADLDPAERDVTLKQILDNMAGAAAGDLELANPNMSAEDASDSATIDIVNELKLTDPAAARAYEAYAIAPPSAAAAGSSSSRVDRGQRSSPRYKGLVDPEIATPTTVVASLSPSEAAEFDKSIAKIGEERALLGLPPALPASDYITLARRIAAGRIAGQVGGPAAPFEQQLRFDKLLNASPEDREALKAAFVASRRGPPAAPPRASAEKLLRGTLSTGDREDTRRGGYATSLAASAPRGEFEFGSAADQIVVEPRGEFEFGSAADQIVVEPRGEFEFGSAADQIVVEPAVARAAPARVSAAPRRRAASPETQAFLEENGAPFEFSSAADQIVVEPPPVMLGPPQAPAGAAGPVRANMGARSALPPTKVDVEAAKTVMREPPPPPTASKYFQNRYEAASDLAQKPDKLARLVASGDGKVVQQIYAANAKTNVPFEVGWQEIALQYSNDVEKLKVAHEILLALDIASKNKIKPKE